MSVIGVISDTHIPDRARRLHQAVIPLFQKAQVEAVLHAGDVSSPTVLEQLGRFSPVYAVRGNRDWVLLRRLPAALSLRFEGVNIALAHGHGRWWNYVQDRLYYMRHGFHLDRFQTRLLKAFPEARVIVFGHTHRALNVVVGNQLVFNPGSPHFPEEKDCAPSVGLLHIAAGGEVKGEIIYLPASKT